MVEYTYGKNEFTGFDPKIQVFLSDFTVFTNIMLAALHLSIEFYM